LARRPKRTAAVATPASAQGVAAVPVEGLADGVAIDGDGAWVAGDDGGVNQPGTLVVADISDPANPTVKASLPTSNRLWGVALTDDLAFAAGTEGGLMIFSRP